MMDTIKTGDRVVLAAIDGAEEAAGTVRDVDGNRVLVRTDDGGTEWADAKLVSLAVTDRSTLRPVTVGGWYENTDGSVTEYVWRSGALHADRTVSGWVDVSERDYAAEDREMHHCYEVACAWTLAHGGDLGSPCPTSLVQTERARARAEGYAAGVAAERAATRRQVRKGRDK